MNTVYVYSVLIVHIDGTDVRIHLGHAYARNTAEAIGLSHQYADEKMADLQGRRSVYVNQIDTAEIKHELGLCDVVPCPNET